MATEYELTFTDYLSIMRRRAPYIIGTFVVGLVVSLLIVIFVPRTYQSTGTILIESPNIAQSLLDNQTQKMQESIDERINSIEQRILTRESLLRIANKYNLFKGSLRFLSSDELVQKMRDAVTVSLINVDTIRGMRKGKTTVAFSVAFEHKNPKIAYLVAKDLVALFMNWNVKIQTENATSTTIFLAQAATKQAKEVQRLNGLISAYKKQHGSALPELTNIHMSMMQQQQVELNRVNQQYDALQAQLAGGNDSKSSPTSLPALKAELANLSTKYNDSYPDIQALKLKIATLEKANKTAGGSTSDTLESLAKQRKKLEDSIAQNQAAIMEAPSVAQGLEVLVSMRDSAQKKYEDLQNQQQNAAMTEKLKKENMGDRFILLDPPAMPGKPYKPNVIKIMVMGIALSIASSGGMLMLMAALDKQIRGANALEQVLGNPPLAVVPYLVLPEEEVAKKRKIIVLIIAFLLGLVAILLLIQFFYMPLNDLFWKILATMLA